MARALGRRRYIPANDPLYASVVSVLSFDGANNSTTFTDDKGKAWTAVGGAKLSTAWQAFGTAAGIFTGPSYISTPNHADFNFGTGDFCVEGQIYPTSAVTGDFIGRRTGGDTANFWFLRRNADGSMRFVNKVANVQTPDIVSAAGVLPLNTKKHWALNRLGNAIVLVVEGAVVASTTYAGSMASPTCPQLIGAGDDSGAGGHVGYVDEVRFTKGASRYPGAYTPPSSAFPRF